MKQVGLRKLLVYVVLGIIVVGGGSKLIFFPARPMFHNVKSPAGTRGLFAFWADPPVVVGDDGRQELHADYLFNVLVLIVRSSEPEHRGWSGSISADIDRSVFTVGGSEFVVSSSVRDTLIVFRDSGSRSEWGLEQDQAREFYEWATNSDDEGRDFVVEIQQRLGIDVLSE